MKIRTSKGNEHELTYAGKPGRDENRLIMEMVDGREMSAVAADFEELGTIADANGKILLDGVLRISAIQRLSDGTYRVTMDKE